MRRPPHFYGVGLRPWHHGAGHAVSDPLMRAGCDAHHSALCGDYARYILFGAGHVRPSCSTNILRGEGKAMLAMVGIGLAAC
ncbi:MAG: hypothetical protein ACLR7U_04635 [Ruthenibacterium lactatiformans]